MALSETDWRIESTLRSIENLLYSISIEMRQEFLGVPKDAFWNGAFVLMGSIIAAAIGLASASRAQRAEKVRTSEEREERCRISTVGCLIKLQAIKAAAHRVAKVINYSFEYSKENPDPLGDYSIPSIPSIRELEEDIQPISSEDLIAASITGQYDLISKIKSTESDFRTLIFMVSNHRERLEFSRAKIAEFLDLARHGTPSQRRVLADDMELIKSSASGSRMELVELAERFEKFATEVGEFMIEISSAFNDAFGHQIGFSVSENGGK